MLELASTSSLRSSKPKVMNSPPSGRPSPSSSLSWSRGTHKPGTELLTAPAPESSPRECLQYGRTYAGRLVIHLQDQQSAQVQAVEAALVPLMTERGTFIIGGREKAVVGRLQIGAEGGPNDLATRRLFLVGQQLEEALTDPLAADLAMAKSAESAAASL